jgi:protein-glutamine gamma-glutamyltransferase
MKPPPLLVGAALLFWGWHSQQLVAGALMGAVLESARWIKPRWEFTDQDFRRIWVFCALLLLTVAVHAFTSTGSPTEFINFLQNPNLVTERNASVNSARAVAIWLRSLPMVFFLFIAAQTFNTREGIPPETISLLMRWRWQRARKQGRPLPPAANVNVSYAYFGVCLFAASFRTREDPTFFWGVCLLVGWALWSLRSRRYSLQVWAGAFAVAIVLGYCTQLGIGHAFRLIENYNPQWLPRSGVGGTDPTQSKTALGRIGRLKLSGRIVIRLEPKDRVPPPTLLREASYSSYRSGTWDAEISRDRYEPVNPHESPTSFNLLPTKTNSLAVNIGCYLPGGSALLPLPRGASRLENLSAFLLYKSPLGAVLAQGPGLVVFDALYGPGETMDSPPDPIKDFAVPFKETSALDKVVSELQLEPNNRRRAERSLIAFFHNTNNFRYSTWQGYGKPYGTNETPLSRFLLQTRAGHCEYFATATVLLLRTLGIPARYAVGYSVHEASGNKYVVRQRDAHAWCLVWNDTARTWQDFDTTPPSWIKEEASRASPVQALSDLWTWLLFEFSKFRWGQSHLREYILWALAPILLLLLYQIIFRARRRHRAQTRGESGPATPWPGLDSEFYQLERKMLARGAGRQPGEPLTAWLLRVMNDPALSDMQEQLRDLLRLHYRYRFDPHGLAPPEREALRRGTQRCLARFN